MKLQFTSPSFSKKIISLCITVALVAACSKSKDVDALIKEGQAAESKGDYKTAVIQLKNALQINPDNADARYLLGVAYNYNGDVRSAEKEFRKALELKKDPAVVLPDLGKALLRQGESRKVLEELGTGEHLSAELLSVRGSAQLSLGMMEDAKSSFEQALAKSPALPDALLGQARLAVMSKNIDGGIKLTEQVLEKSPSYLDALMLKADFLRLKNDSEAALTAYRKVIDHYQDNLPARLNMASVYIGLNKYEDASKQLDDVRKLSPQSPMTSYLQALIEFKQQNYAKAREDVLQVLKFAPNHLPSQMLGGSVEYALGNYAQSEQYLRAVLEKAPNNLYARKMLILALLRAHQVSRAIDILQPALTQAPEDSAVLALAGEVYMQNNEFSKASQFYEKAAQIDPKNAQTRTGLGLSRLAAGEADRAMADLEVATDLDGKTYQADVMLITTHLTRHEYDKALKAIDVLEKKQPQNPLTFNLRGAAQIGQKKFSEARASLQKALSLQPTYFPAAMNLAQLDLQDKNPKAARKRFEEILAKDPNNLQALIALAGMGSKINAAPDEITGWLMQAKKGNPASPQPSLLLARYYLNARDAKKALESAVDAQTISPDNPEVMDTLGTVQLAVGEKNAAITTFGKLVAAQPKSALSYMRLANAQYANEDSDGARSSLKRALEIKPDLTEASVAMVALETGAKRFADAMQVVKKVQSQSPNSAIGNMLEGDVRFEEKQYALAAAAYEKAYSISRSGPLIMKWHSALTQSGKMDEADAKLSAWLKDNPNDVSARIYLADAYLKRQKYKPAIEQYEWIYKLQPQNLLVMNNLAWAYQQARDPRALTIAEQAYKAAPNNAAVIDTYAWMLVENGQQDKGIDLLQKAISIAPGQQDVRFHYASALYRSGKKDQARIELERILASGVKFAQESEAAALLAQLKK